jgi:small-conductance mechanosensitive channel
MATTTEQNSYGKLLAPFVVFTFVFLVYLGRDVPLATIPLEDIDGVSRTAGYALAIGLWLSGTHLFNRILKIVFWERMVARVLGGPVPQLLVNLTSLLIYVFTVTVIVGVVFKAPLTGVWTTSGVIGIVIRFALRNTIADLFTGIAINVDHPYRIGDWIQVHGATPPL